MKSPKHKNSIEKYAQEYHQVYAEETPKNLEKILRNNNFHTLLDVGCGDGNLLRSIALKRYLDEDKIIGVDLSAKRIRLVKKILPKAKLLVDSAETLKKIKSKSIDLLISTQVIEHVDDAKMTGAMARVMKKGGLLYLSTVFKKWYGWYYIRRGGKWLLDPTHLREYTGDEQLLGILRKHFSLIYEEKSQVRYPIIDFFLNTIHYNNRLRTSPFWSMLRAIKIPIPGYYSWELILIKK